MTFCLAMLSATGSPASARPVEPPPEVARLLERLDPRSGGIAITQAHASLDLGEDYIFYGPQDARSILIGLWGNHPDEANSALGLVMPAGTTPLSDSWGAVVTFEQSGWVSNADAREVDPEAVLDAMRQTSADLNARRRAAGNAGVEIVGWVAQPRYDSVDHSVVWARELDFDDADVNTLNYEIRALGRRGVLSLNVVSAMPRLAEIREAADALAGRAAFDPGYRYADYDSATDVAAGYGIAGLVAGGAGLAVAKNAGAFALLVKVAKPLIVAALILAGLFFGPLRRLIGRRRVAGQT
ncbi:DUF2167 domain-containing protein [Aurantiacibacter spongiae]|uniref:DUF2167 domain-containing protein n=1 Tax=Aurantiacibacter spongiae TaxID=2488860 RepID=UPI00131538E1|nr:DUF2167 domain-containing protein [Aurantiacibacter spongiae]